MGEVYRADDLKLGQPVALKFLPRALSADPVQLERFFSEVRITRLVSHPNVCRVYDIGEYDGQHFLSMEYIDGEDLASLIKRIGYLSSEKALEIARQLIAGLAAAHDRGVLHRDLKPANIMIDGRGRVRITDFGLAVAATDETRAAEILGTPIYMAPEQFEGKGASVQSDIYALGLVLYEIYCGKHAFTGTTLAEIREQKERRTPPSLSEIRPGVDAAVERLIMRCIERDPHLRPASVTQLALALPGGDPLAAAIAAGETPSPEMVAASGVKEGLRPAFAVALLATVLLGAVAIMAMNPRMTLLQRIPSGKAREVLIERVQQLLKKTGYTEEADNANGFTYNFDLIQHFRDANATPSRWKDVEVLHPIVFWYRSSPRPMQHLRTSDVLSRVTPLEPPMLFSGEVTIVLNTEGQLRSFLALPPEQDAPIPNPPSSDWGLLFSEAGLDISKWTPTEPKVTPLFYADSRLAWEGAFEEAPHIPIRIEAASYRGRPVSFLVQGPWSRANRMISTPISMVQKITNWTSVVVLVACFGGGLLFARTNLRYGRGDRRGATRLATFVLILLTLDWAAAEHHVATLWELYLVLFGFAAYTLLMAAFVWTLYVALEPPVRRRWPKVLVSWTRLLAGQWRDPLVCSDLLVGCATGVALASGMRLSAIAPRWVGSPEEVLLPGLTPIEGPGAFLAWLFYLPVGAINNTIGVLFLLFLLRVLVRSERWAAVIIALVFALGGLGATVPWIGIPSIFLLVWIFLMVLIRFGLLAAIVAEFAYLMLFEAPMTMTSSAWYFGSGFAALLVLIGITLYGFRLSLGRRPLFDIAGVEH